MYKDKKAGFIDRDGKLVIAAIDDDTGDFSEGVAWVVQGQRCGYVDRAGIVVIPLQCERAPYGLHR